MAEQFTPEEFKAFIVRTLNLEGVDPAAIADDDPLFGDGLGLDSVDALELVVALEKRFGLKLRTEEIDPATFATAGALFTYVRARLAGGGRSGDDGDHPAP